MITGNKIRLVRQLKNIPPKEMADKLDMDYSTYTRLERGSTKLTEDRVEDILKALDVTREFIDHIEKHMKEIKDDKNTEAVKNIPTPEESLHKTLQLVSEQIENQNKLIENFIAYISKK